MGFTPPRRVQIEFSHAVQTVADRSGEEVTGDAICSLFRREYFETTGPAARNGGTMSWQRHEIAAGAAIPGDAGEEAVVAHAAAAFANAAGTTIEIVSVESARTVDGRVAVFVGARMGDAPMRYGVGAHEEAVVAAIDALASSINRSDWHCSDRRAAA